MTAPQLKVSIDPKRKVMVIEVPTQDPTPSKSGKTLVVASTYGNVTTDCKVNGKLVTLGLNAYIKA